MTEPTDFAIPPLRQRVMQLVRIGWCIAAIRLGLDFWDRDAAMWFGLYYLMPAAILVLGLKRVWGPIGWRPMAGTMLLVGVLVWGVWNSISYTTGQFLEWTDGRFYPGDPANDWAGARADRVRDTALGKIGAGLLHGLISSATGSIWCIAAGSLFVWVPRRTLRK